MDVYAVGRRIRLESSESNLLTDMLGSLAFEVQVESHLSVGMGRRSQVLLVRVIQASDPLMFVAKCFDPACHPSVDPLEWPGGPQQACESGKQAEVAAYARLKQLQGINIPTFYGEYQYRTDGPFSTRASAIIIEFIDTPRLADQNREEFTSTQLTALETGVFALLDKIQDCGVYRIDFNTANWFWDRGNVIKLCDFEDTIVESDEIADSIGQCVAQDRGNLEAMLIECGVEYKGPPPPEWAFGTLWHP